MERRGEGFERERYVPEQGREVRREGVEREPIREPVGREPQREPMTHEPYREPRRYEMYGEEEPGIFLRPRDLTRWGPVFAGFFVALGLAILLGVLGVAVGLGAGDAAAVGTTSAAIWGAVVLIVSFFAGGWVAGRAAQIGGTLVGTIHGVAVWALTITVLLVLGTLGLVPMLGALLGPGLGAPGGPGVSVVGPAAWGAFIALFVGLIAAAAGGYIGGQTIPRGNVPPPIGR